MVPGQPWSEQELIDLGQLCSVGIPIEHVAKFLGRNLDEVERQARLISTHFAQSSGYSPLLTAPKRFGNRAILTATRRASSSVKTLA